MLDGGGLGDISTISTTLKGKRCFTQLDSARGFQQIHVAEVDRHKTAFRDSQGRLFELARAGFGLTVFPAALTQIVTRALVNPYPNVVSGFNDILASNHTWQKYLPTIAGVVTKLSKARLSVNFAKCHFASSSQEFFEMIVDDTEMKPAPSKLEAIAKMAVPNSVQQLRSVFGRTRYLRNFVQDYSTIAAPLIDL